MNTYQEPEWRRLQLASRGSESGLLPARQMETVTAAPPPKGLSYLQLAWGHKFLLLAIILIGGLGGACYVTLTTPLYVSATTVEVVGMNERFMGMGQLDPQTGTDLPDVQTEVRVLTSRGLLSRVRERLNVEMPPVTSPPETFFTKLRTRIPFLKPETLVDNKEAFDDAQATLVARGLVGTRLIELQCESTLPEVAVAFLKTLVAENATQARDARSLRAQGTSQWMGQQLDEARARLKQANDNLRDFMQRSGSDFFPDQSTLADSKWKSLQGDLSTIQADRIAKQARWELAKNTAPQMLPDVMGDASLQALKGQIASLERDKAQLLVRLTPQHDKVRAVQVQITETQQTLEKEEASFLKRLESDYQEALRREKLLSSAYSAQTHSVSSQVGKAGEYAMLKRDAEMEQQLYTSLLQQYNQATLVALVPANSVRTVDEPFLSPIPSSPKPAADIAGSAAGAGVLAYAIIWLFETTRRKKLAHLFDAPGHSQTVLGVPELGVIPSTNEPAPRRRLRMRTPLRTLRSGDTLEPLESEANAEATALEAWQKADSSVLLSESFRQTLVSLLRNRPKDHRPVYVITSAGPGEGKTTLSANLARAMAEVGHRVLLVDADLRRPQVHSRLGSNDHPGLSDILTSSTEIKDCNLDLFIQSTPHADLNVMTHGLVPVESPAILFFSPRVAQLTARLQSRFDFVLFDTAPALPFPDARLWGKHSDGIVLVVRSGVTTREGATAACQRFVADGIPVLGTILNDWMPKDHSDSNYYYSYSYKANRLKKDS